mmetsp:Transcript_62946/g.149978  ORF Transcript_62946/g.149978 Transcript_62946/m.149978 type:complete len:128 (+) Transcript_62946:83-466(+)|eukprot:CAMPEP_0178404970 /NCGR_PEP_ID=MMETSP0689_2-20121128/18161_1 /TAXON_ID=160604 /ORGANISM="Amphidinium massartii, Strain CS-259" /LENGTH=127 /DNA_ID=CAMNT_0020025977 /DNA_START=76 /DNA_END=459 /DNA_ORIENTATION=+
MASMSSVFVGLALIFASVQDALGAGHMGQIRCINETHHAHMHAGDHAGHDHGHSDMDEDWEVMMSTSAHNPCNETGCMPVCDATSCTPEYCNETTTTEVVGPVAGATRAATFVAAVATSAVAYVQLV